MPQVPVIDSATFITPLDEKTGEDLGGGWSRMNPTPDIGWKQRLTNFDRAFALLADAMANGPAALNQLKKEGVIQRFGQGQDDQNENRLKRKSSDRIHLVATAGLCRICILGLRICRFYIITPLRGGGCAQIRLWI